MATAALVSALVVAAALAGCRDERERFEEISKLRALGVAAAPVIAKPSTADAPQVTALTFYAAVPRDRTVTAAPFVDDRAKYGPPVPVTVDPAGVATEDHRAFKIVSVGATLPIPDAATLGLDRPDVRFARVRYGVTLTADDGEEDVVVGDVLVYPDGAAELAWTAPTADIANPLPDQVLGDEADLVGAVETTAPEALRVGWFVSDGAVKNRRAKETTWETPAAGGHTVVLTVRGRSSGGFALKVVDVTVE